MMKSSPLDSLQGRFYAQLERAPGRRAWGFFDPRGAISWLTLREVYERAASSAARLAESGLTQGEVCVIVMPSGELSARLVLSSLLLGALPLLVAPPTLQGLHSNLPQVLRRTIKKTRARVVVGSESIAGVSGDLRRLAPRTRFLYGEAEVDGGGHRPSLPVVSPTGGDVAAMQLTSGTTGFPRICVWKQRPVLAAIDGMAAAMMLSEEDICFNWTPLYHDMGLVNNLLTCLIRGVPLAMLGPQEFVKTPALWLRGLHDTGSTVTWSPNFGFALAAQRVKEEQLTGVRLDGVRAFWNAAERIHLSTMRAFFERFAPFGVRYDALKTNFGCAENVGGATFSDLDGPFLVERVDGDLLAQRRIARPVGADHPGRVATVVGVGRPYPGMTIRILSRTGRPLRDGEVGEIALQTPSRMVGYLGDVRANRRAIRGKLLRTGDIGYVRKGHLFWVGRDRERITVRGKKLDPSDFEAVLLAVPDLRQGCFAAFGVDDERHGTQRVVIVTEVREPLSRPQKDIALDVARGAFLHLGVTVSDVILVRVGTLAKTSSGKRRHRHFHQLYLKGGLLPFAVGQEGSP